MHRRSRLWLDLIWGGLLVFWAPSAASAVTLEDQWRTGGPLATDGARGQLFALDPLSGAVERFDLEGQRSAVWRVGAQPAQLLLMKDGAIVVSDRSGTLTRFSAAGESRGIELSGEPYGLASASDGRLIYVTLAARGEVVALEAHTLQERWRTKVAARPRPIAWVNANVLLVGHLDQPFLTVVNPSTGAADQRLPLHGNGVRRATQTWSIQVREDRIFAVHRTVATGAEDALSLPPKARVFKRCKGCGRLGLQTAGYGGFRDPIQTVVTEFRVDPARPLPYRVRDHITLGRGLTSGASAALVLEIQGKTSLVVGALRSAPHQFILRRRTKFGTTPPGVSGRAARGVRGVSGFAPAHHGDAFYALDPWKRTIFRIPYRRARVGRAQQIVKLQPAPEEPKSITRGRALFHDTGSRVSARRLACASCHPEGREDGLVWRFGRELRQTPMLAGRLRDTGPYHWTGTATTLEASVKETIQRLGGLGLSRRQRRDLAHYILEGLPPVPKPRIEAEHRELVQRGEEIFGRRETGCSSCHLSGAEFSDGMAHKVGTSRRALDTPSLTRLALTPPYLHDGSAPDLESLLAITEGGMGRTSHLDGEEREALLAYLRSL